MSEDLHFADLAKGLKRAEHLHFSAVIEWYTEHYMMVRKPTNPLYYADPLRHLIVGYVERQNFVKMSDLIKRLSPSNWMPCSFTDLDKETNDNFDIRVIAECCSIIRLLEVSRIPGYEI